MKRIVRLDIPEDLNQELLLASDICGVNPSQFCAEAIECVLAARRLPNVRPPKFPKGARPLGIVTPKPKIAAAAEPEPVLRAGEIPSAFDLETLADLR